MDMKKRERGAADRDGEAGEHAIDERVRKVSRFGVTMFAPLRLGGFKYLFLSSSCCNKTS